MWHCSVSVTGMYMHTHVRENIVTSIILYTGDNGTVVYLEEVPIQSLPAIKGVYTCISSSYESLQLDTHIYMYVYALQRTCMYICVNVLFSRDDRSRCRQLGIMEL